MIKNALATSFAICPLSLVRIAAHMLKAAVAMCLILLPLPLISRTILPYLNTLAVSETSQPLSSVDGT